MHRVLDVYGTVINYLINGNLQYLAWPAVGVAFVHMKTLQHPHHVLHLKHALTTPQTPHPEADRPLAHAVFVSARWATQQPLAALPPLP